MDQSKQRILRHKPWPIWEIVDCQYSCRLSRRLQTVKAVTNFKDTCTKVCSYLFSEMMIRYVSNRWRHDHDFCFRQRFCKFSLVIILSNVKLS